MDISKIKTPQELPFKVPNDVAESINNLISALERDDEALLDCYLDDVEQVARMVSEEQDMWLRNYYVKFGWMKG